MEFNLSVLYDRDKTPPKLNNDLPLSQNYNRILLDAVRRNTKGTTIRLITLERTKHGKLRDSDIMVLVSHRNTWLIRPIIRILLNQVYILRI